MATEMLNNREDVIDTHTHKYTHTLQFLWG